MTTTRKPPASRASAEKAPATRRPAAARTPQDRKAKTSARTDAHEGEVRFEYEGHEYSVGPEAKTDLELMEAVEDQRYIAAVRGYLGKAQWDTFKELHRGKDGRVDVAVFEGFLQILMDHVGNS